MVAFVIMVAFVVSNVTTHHIFALLAVAQVNLAGNVDIFEFAKSYF